MEDKEMLEFAAKAAGIEHDGCTDWKEPALRIVGERLTYWNPLTDDGDALRLAVKLKIELGYLIGNSVWAKEWSSSAVFKESNERNGGTQDPYAATRRAIVRAAAEIGKSML